jgi:hypothetical protein
METEHQTRDSEQDERERGSGAHRHMRKPVVSSGPTLWSDERESVNERSVPRLYVRYMRLRIVGRHVQQDVAPAARHVGHVPVLRERADDSLRSLNLSERDERLAGLVQRGRDGGSRLRLALGTDNGCPLLLRGLRVCVSARSRDRRDEAS